MNGTLLEKSAFKTYANVLTKVKTFSKKIYYQSEVKNIKTNLKKLWNTLRTLLPNGKRDVFADIQKLNCNGTEISDVNEISQTF